MIPHSLHFSWKKKLGEFAPRRDRGGGTLSIGKKFLEKKKGHSLIDGSSEKEGRKGKTSSPRLISCSKKGKTGAGSKTPQKIVGEKKKKGRARKLLKPVSPRPVKTGGKKRMKENQLFSKVVSREGKKKREKRGHLS